MHETTIKLLEAHRAAYATEDDGEWDDGEWEEAYNGPNGVFASERAWGEAGCPDLGTGAADLIARSGLSVRAKNCLEAGGLVTFADVAALWSGCAPNVANAELLRIKNLGLVTLNEIRVELQRRGWFAPGRS